MTKIDIGSPAIECYVCAIQFRNRSPSYPDEVCFYYMGDKGASRLRLSDLDDENLLRASQGFNFRIGEHEDGIVIGHLVEESIETAKAIICEREAEQLEKYAKQTVQNNNKMRI